MSLRRAAWAAGPRRAVACAVRSLVPRVFLPPGVTAAPDTRESVDEAHRPVGSGAAPMAPPALGLAVASHVSHDSRRSPLVSGRRGCPRTCGPLHVGAQHRVSDCRLCGGSCPVGRPVALGARRRARKSLGACRPCDWDLLPPVVDHCGAEGCGISPSEIVQTAPRQGASPVRLRGYPIRLGRHSAPCLR